MIYVPPIAIPSSEIELTYARSSGPGGQNVNKVNSKALLRWNIRESPSLGEEVRVLLLRRLESRLNSLGEILIMSDRYRDQIRNREDCIEKLKECLKNALFIPKARKKTKPSKSSVRRAKDKKSHHSKKKNLRRKPSPRD